MKPGGIAAFAEPGPNHSKAPQSQYEMRTYRVLENDVAIERIWEVARRSGFTDIRVAAYNIPPFHVSLEEYQNLLVGGEVFEQWGNATLRFLQDVRMFFLHRVGREVADSRRSQGLSAHIEAAVSSDLRATLVVRNVGTSVWLPGSAGFGGVSLGAHLYDAGGALLALDWTWIAIHEPVAPGEERRLAAELPALDPGRYRIEFDCVANDVAWFAQLGSQPASVDLEVS